MAVGYRLPRGTRAALNAKVAGGTIVVGQVYLVSDEGRLAVGLTASSIGDLPALAAANIFSQPQVVGGVPPTAGALNVVGASGGIALALSDNANSSLYVRTASGGAIIGPDGGSVVHIAGGGNGTANRLLTVQAASTNETGILLWIDTGGGATQRRVSVGAADSGGSGRRLLTVPN